jgi:hypothetical protein
VLASSDHGTMIVNRFDYHMVDADRGFGVASISSTPAFDLTGVEMTTGLLKLRRHHFGDGVTAIDCGEYRVFTSVDADRVGNVIAIKAQAVYYPGRLSRQQLLQYARSARTDQADDEIPQLDHTRPANFGSVEIKRRGPPSSPAGDRYDAPGAGKSPA